MLQRSFKQHLKLTQGGFFSYLQAVEDVHVTYEDQQRINNFATNMRRMTELKNELEAKKVSPQHRGADAWIVF